MTEMTTIWPIIFIVIAIAMAVGPIMMFKPNSRDRRLGELRQAAALAGIRVRLTSMAGTNGKTTVAVYSLLFDDQQDSQAKKQRPSWTLIKGTLSHDLHFSGYWDWADKHHHAPEPYHQGLSEWIHSVDDSVMGIEVNQHSVGIYWTERNLDITAVENILNQWRKQFV